MPCFRYVGLRFSRDQEVRDTRFRNQNIGSCPHQVEDRAFLLERDREDRVVFLTRLRYGESPPFQVDMQLCSECDPLLSPYSQLLLLVSDDSMGAWHSLGPLLDNPNWVPYTQCIDRPRGEMCGGIVMRPLRPMDRSPFRLIGCMQHSAADRSDIPDRCSDWRFMRVLYANLLHNDCGQKE